MFPNRNSVSTSRMALDTNYHGQLGLGHDTDQPLPRRLSVVPWAQGRSRGPKFHAPVSHHLVRNRIFNLF